MPQATRASREHKRQSIVDEEFDEGKDYNKDDGVLDDKEGVFATHIEKSRGPLVRFPTHEKYMEGYIWKMDFFFNAKIANIRAVENVETNHCMLMKKHVTMMYNRLCRKNQYNMSVLIL